jgi:hypothetical protein
VNRFFKPKKQLFGYVVVITTLMKWLCQEKNTSGFNLIIQTWIYMSKGSNSLMTDKETGSMNSSMRV